MEPREVIEKEGIGFYECHRCGGRVIFELKGDIPDYRFLPGNGPPN